MIELLSEHVANQIAAGEVIQRPASAVKELLENAIDANSTLIQLIIKDAGESLVQVIDNGSGMTKEDAEICFKKHATSKIKLTEDLFAISSKGFRGEALSSIAAVSQVELKTKKQIVTLVIKLKLKHQKLLTPNLVPTQTELVYQ
jgi:DNA mismatch repair protein MutL